MITRTGYVTAILGVLLIVFWAFNPSVSLPDGTSSSGVHLGPSRALAQSSDPVKVVSLETSPTQPTPGDTITVTATVMNEGSDANVRELDMVVNGEVAGSQSVTVEPGETGKIDFSYEVVELGDLNIAVGEVSATVKIDYMVLHHPPDMRFDVVRTEIMPGQDAELNLNWHNSELNDREIRFEVLVDISSDLYIYEEIGAMQCSAGRCVGVFTAPPGTVRDLPIAIWSNKAGSYYIHVHGRYWPEDRPDLWTPLSLETPIEVLVVRESPRSLTPLVLGSLALLALLGIVVIAGTGYWAYSRNRSNVSL